MGSFFRASDSRTLLRYRCSFCGKSFSQATHSAYFRQHKRRINIPLYRLLCSGVSLRRSAKLLNVDRKTVVRKFHFLAELATKKQAQFLLRYQLNPTHEVIFDEMESFEHTKLKPVSIALAVSAERKILTTQVARMPAKGLLVAKSLKKYGYRRDERPNALRQMFEDLKKVASPHTLFKSDQNPHYRLPLLRAFPNARYETTKGGRGCIVGQGELKKLKWDTLFSLNHTAAMFRANMNRLFRRTWCTTKTLKGLRSHLALYVSFHNTLLTA